MLTVRGPGFRLGGAIPLEFHDAPRRPSIARGGHLDQRQATCSRPEFGWPPNARTRTDLEVDGEATARGPSPWAPRRLALPGPGPAPAPGEVLRMSTMRLWRLDLVPFSTARGVQLRLARGRRADRRQGVQFGPGPVRWRDNGWVDPLTSWTPKSLHEPRISSSTASRVR